MAPRETENNAYANFWGDKQRGLWYAVVFSGVVNSSSYPHSKVLYNLHENVKHTRRLNQEF